MPQLFDQATINRFLAQAEELFANKTKCIIDRYALNILAGVAEYTLPDYVLDVRRVTYRGVKIYPEGHRASRESNLSLTSTGTPTDYIYNNIGINKIKLYPIPNEHILAVQSNLFSVASIQSQCIVEFSRTPDGIANVIPTFIRRRFLKSYALAMCFAMEGKGQNVKASKYWTSKWEALQEIYTDLLEDLINHPRKLIATDAVYYDQRPGRLRFPEYARGIWLNAGE